jgi:hypothetical protein
VHITARVPDHCHGYSCKLQVSYVLNAALRSRKIQLRPRYMGLQISPLTASYSPQVSSASEYSLTKAQGH